MAFCLFGFANLLGLVGVFCCFEGVLLLFLFCFAFDCHKRRMEPLNLEKNRSSKFNVGKLL